MLVLRRAVVAAAALIAAFVVTPAAASARPGYVNPCARTSFAPGTVSVGLGTAAVVSFSTGDINDDHGECGDFLGWELRIPDLNVDVTSHAPAAAFDPGWYTNADAGRLASVDVRVTASTPNDDAQTIFPLAFSVHRGTTWTATTESPTSVAPAGTLHMTGTISLANWDTDTYDHYPDRGVSLQWAYQPGYATTDIALGHADSRGTVSLTGKAPAGVNPGTGYVRLHYGGNTIAGASGSAWYPVQVT